MEQSGSWHTTVGHGHSMSAQRYLFDLSLLEKDLATYGHDPHTHYYLGVTHEAYAQARLLDGADVSDVEFHIKTAIKYLTMRVEDSYSLENIGERHSTLYALGHLYAALLVYFT